MRETKNPIMRTRPPANGFQKSFPLTKDSDFLNLTVEERRFVYNIFLKPKTKWSNARCYKDAYLRDVMNYNTAANAADRLLKKAKISKCVKKLQRYEIQKLNITTARILREEARLAFVDITDIFDDDGALIINPKDLPIEVRKSISSIEQIDSFVPGEKRYKIKFWDKGAALKRLQSIKGLNAPSKHELSGPNGKPLELNHTFAELDLSVLSDSELSTLIELTTKIRRGSKR